MLIKSQLKMLQRKKDCLNETDTIKKGKMVMLLDEK